tara:strand:+ start:1035 stop:2510 length:1476 start_codon:yes stop_codon:yes gene_type:complete
MALVKLDIPAGAVRNGTEYETGGRWRDMSLVRFFNNVIQPIGGWRLRIATQLSGVPRAIRAWRDNDGNRWLGIGTHTKLYALSGGGDLYDITPAGFTTGIADAAGAVGYGVGPFGSYEYGLPRPDSASTNVLDASAWSLDTWGENLIGCMHGDGKIYEWPLDTIGSVAAVQVANAPINCAGVIVSEERILFAYGANGNDRDIYWSDQENNTNWTPAAANQAGSQLLQTNGRITAACRVNGGTLFLTDVDAHQAVYTGAPFVYRFDRIGTSCGVISRGALVQVENVAMWMGHGGFWTSSGSVAPIDCSVSEYIFNDINKEQVSKIVGHVNIQYGEVTWWYPSEASSENDRYVIFNYRNGTWATGYLSRTCGSDGGVFGSPVVCDPDGYIYDTEIGLVDGAYAETGPIEIASGDNLTVITKVIPDTSNLGDATVTFTSRLYPTAEETVHGPYSLSNPTNVRLQGRQIKMKVTGGSVDWRVGDMRIDVKQGSRR